MLNKSVDVSCLQAVDYDRLLAGFNQAAGLSTSYSLYSGWENSLIQAHTGHTRGHYMVAPARADKNTKIMAVSISTNEPAVNAGSY